MIVRPNIPTRIDTHFLLWLPFVVLIIPQGTITRTFIPEVFFATFLFVAMLAVLLRASLKGQLISMPRSRINSPLLILIVYFLFLNPLLSVLYGNDFQRMLLTALSFVLLAVYYLISVQGLGVIKTRRLVMAFGVSGVVISMLVIGNYFLGDTSASDMRSTSIKGSRTLTLPLIPMAGVLFLSLTLTTRHRRTMLVFATLATICVIAVIMTVTRAMLLAYCAGIAIVFWLLITGHSNHHQRRHVFKVLGYFATAVLLLSTPFIAPWLSRLDPESEGDVGTILGRFDEYAAFLDGFFNSPIFGQGLGHLFVYPSLFDLTLSERGITVCHSHFFFLAGTTGLVGMLLYYTVIGAGIMRHWKMSRSMSMGDDSVGYVIGMLGAAVTGLLFTLSSTTFTTLSYNLFLAIFLHTSRLNWNAR
jgi:hypothetical protein